jgi:putative phosphoesterase
MLPDPDASGGTIRAAGRFGVDYLFRICSRATRARGMVIQTPMHRARRSQTAKGKAQTAPPRDVLAMTPRGLRIVVISDTHGNPHPRAVERVGELVPDAILHGGDIGALDVLGLFEPIAPLLAVRGNIDVHATQVPEHRLIDVCDGDRTLVTILLTHIAVYGPKLRAEVGRMARLGDASLVVCGHSHVPFQGRDQGMALFNPGSIGPRRFGLPIVFGVIDIEPTKVTMRHIDVEGGQEWRANA